MCELVGSVNEPLSHLWAVPGQLHNAQIPANLPLIHVQTAKLRSRIGHNRQL